MSCCLVVVRYSCCCFGVSLGSGLGIVFGSGWALVVGFWW